MPAKRDLYDWEKPIILKAAKDKKPFTGSPDSLLAQLRHEGQKRGNPSYTPGFSREEVQSYLKHTGATYDVSAPDKAAPKPAPLKPGQAGIGPVKDRANLIPVTTDAQGQILYGKDKKPYAELKTQKVKKTGQATIGNAKKSGPPITEQGGKIVVGKAPRQSRDDSVSNYDPAVDFMAEGLLNAIPGPAHAMAVKNIVETARDRKKPTLQKAVDIGLNALTLAEPVIGKAARAAKAAKEAETVAAANREQSRLIEEYLARTPEPPPVSVKPEIPPSAPETGGVFDAGSTTVDAPPAPVEVAPPTPKQPHEMTKAEFNAARPPVDGYLYHGSPEGDLTALDPNYHTKTWREGIGFYATDSRDAAGMYARGRTAAGDRKAQALTGGKVNYVQATPEKALDLDAPADWDLWDSVLKDNLGAKREDLHLPEKPDLTNNDVRQAVKEYIADGGLGDHPGYAMEEIFNSHGIQATTHTEGVKAGKPHRVTIFKDVPYDPADPQPYPAGRIVPPDEVHRQAVEKALAEGKPVPSEVLAEYPDLAPNAPEIATVPSDTIALRTNTANPLQNMQEIATPPQTIPDNGQVIPDNALATGFSPPDAFGQSANDLSPAPVENALPGDGSGVVQFVSGKKGGGYPHPTLKDSLRGHALSFANEYDRRTGQLASLTAEGIPHKVLGQGLGIWDGVDPSFRIEIPGDDPKLFNYVASRYGHALDQDAVAVVVKNPKVYNRIGYEFDAPGKQPIPVKRFEQMAQWFDGLGINIQTDATRNKIEAHFFPTWETGVQDHPEEWSQRFHAATELWNQSNPDLQLSPQEIKGYSYLVERPDYETSIASFKSQNPDHIDPGEFDRLQHDHEAAYVQREPPSDEGGTAGSPGEPPPTDGGDGGANAGGAGVAPASATETAPEVSSASDLSQLNAPDLNAPATPPTGPRIPVEPIPGGSPKRLSQIQLDLNRAMGKKVRLGKTPARVAGSYQPGTTRTVVKFAGDLDTTAHELAHALDDEYGIVGQWVNDPTSPYDAELLPRFSQHGSPSQNIAVQRAEGVAEWLRAYVVNPEAAKQAAPDFYQHIQGIVPENVLKHLDAFSKDVREWAGLPASQRTLANVRTDIEGQSLLQQARGLNGNGYTFETTPIDRFKAAVLDDLAPVVKGINAAKDMKGVNPLPSADPETMIRLYSGELDKITRIMDAGPQDVDGNIVPGLEGGFSKLLEPFDKTSPETLRRDMDDTLAYMISQRTLHEGDLAIAAGKTPGRISGAGAGLQSDYDLAKETLAEISSDPAKLAKVEAGAKLYREWGDWLLGYLRDKGRLSQEAYDAIKADNPYYVDMHRVMDNLEMTEEAGRRMPGAAGKRLDAAKQPIQTFKGSSREIEDPYVSLMKQTHTAVTEADRNEAIRLFTDLLRSDRTMYEGMPKALAEIGTQVPEGTKGAIKVWNEGNPEHWLFEQGIRDSLNRWGETYDSNILTKMAGLTRKMIVDTPGFAIRNLIRDTTDRAVKSEVGSGLSDFFKGRLGNEGDRLSRFGGGQAGHYLTSPKDYHDALAEIMNHEAKQGKNLIMVAGEKYEDVLKRSEALNREAELRKAYAYAKNTLKYGEKDANLYAARKARELLDFSVAGSAIRKINRYIPFTNAAIQGLRRTAMSASKNPGAFLARWSAYVTAPTLAVYEWNAHQGKAVMDEYHQLPAYQRDFFYNFKVGDMWVKVPKPYEIGVLSSGLERALDAAQTGNPNAGEGYLSDLAKAMMPVDESAVIAGPIANRPIVENVANYDFFRGRPIVSGFDDDLALEERKKTENASRLGSAIGKYVPMDPRKIDHLIQGYGGGFGSAATHLSDLGRKDRYSDPKFNILSTLTGMVSDEPVSNALDVQAVLNIIRQRGLGSRSEARQFTSLLSAYHNAKTEKEKERLGELARNTATRIRPTLETFDRNRHKTLKENERKRARVLAGP